jgi:hypothetical protein
MTGHNGNGKGAAPPKEAPRNGASVIVPPRLPGPGAVTLRFGRVLGRRFTRKNQKLLA